MNTPEPKPDNGSILKPLDSSSKAAIVGGMPLAVATVWFIQEFVVPAGKVIEPTVAMALGTVGATVFGELWVVFKRLLDRIGGPK